MQGLSQGQYAKHRGCSRPYISKLVKQGKIPTLPDRSIDPEAADEALRKIADPARTKAEKPQPRGKAKARPKAKAKAKAEPEPDLKGPDILTFADAKAKHESYRAKLAKLKYEQESKKLVDRDLVVKTAATAGRIAVTRFMALPTKLAPILKAETDQRVIHDLLESEIRTVITEFRQALKRLSGSS